MPVPQGNRPDQRRSPPESVAEEAHLVDVDAATVRYALAVDPPWMAAEEGGAVIPEAIPLPQQGALVQAWIGALVAQAEQGQYAAETVETYRRNIRHWLRFLATIARTDAPTPVTVGEFIAAILPHRRPAAVNALIHTLRSCYRFAEASGRGSDIARTARGLRLHLDGPLPALTHAQVVALLALLPDDQTLARRRDRALVATLYGTACRCISLARATVGGVDLTVGTLRHAPKGHRGADVVVALPPSVAALLGEYLTVRRAELGAATTDPLFIALDRGSRGRALTTRSMRRIILGLMERAGHARRDADGKLHQPGVFSAHSLRRSALTTAAEAEGLEAAQALAGHARIETTRRAYVRVKMHARLQRVAGALDLTPPAPPVPPPAAPPAP